ncbi:MAG: hypothetical protein QG612_1245 [Pseudomonadota bacterium]|nr:hypothetical protein [Pseudomonadota bacterium]
MFQFVAAPILAVLMAFGSGVRADEGRDMAASAGLRGEERVRQDERSSYFQRSRPVRIPLAQLPPEGECRLWHPERLAAPPQSAFRCEDTPTGIEPGAWLISPGPRAQEVRVQVYDARQPGRVIDAALFDARSGAMIRVLGRP